MLQVQDGFHLRLPDGVASSAQSYWLSPGGVVDDSDAFIKWAIRGQEHKFVPAQKDAQPDELPACMISQRMAFYKRIEAEKDKTPVQKASEKAAAIAAATGSTLGIEAPSIGKPQKAGK